MPGAKSALAVAAWLTSRGGFVSEYIAPCADATTGTGLCATARLPAPAARRAVVELVRVPIALAIVTDPIQIQEAIHPIHPIQIQEAAARPDTKKRQRTALSMRLLEEKAKGVTSAWSVYIDALSAPTASTSAAVGDNVRGARQCTTTTARSGLELVLHRRHSAMRSEYEEVCCGTLSEFKDVCCGAFSFEEFAWSRNIVQTRAFTVSGKWRALLPFGDYTNHHGSRANVEWRMDDTDFLLVQKYASEDILLGEQLFMSYGSNMPPSVLLLSYGFFEGHLACVDVVLEGDIFCLGRDVRMATSLGKALGRLIPLVRGDPQRTLALLLKAVVEQEERLSTPQTDSCLPPSSLEVARYHAEQGQILSHLRGVIESAMLYSNESALAATKQPASFAVGTVLYHFAENQILPARIITVTPDGAFGVEHLFEWPSFGPTTNSGELRVVDNVAPTALIKQAPYLWLAVASLVSPS